MDLNQEIIAKIDELLPRPGLQDYPDLGVKLAVRSHCVAPTNCLYPMMLLYVASGEKCTWGSNDREYRGRAGEIMIYAVDTPAMTAVTKASAAEPMRCIGVLLDFAVLSEQFARIRQKGCLRQTMPDDEEFSLIKTFKAGEDFKLNLIRLLNLARSASGDAIGRLKQELLMQELMLGLIESNGAAYLTHLLQSEGRENRILKAVRYIKDNFTQELNFTALAQRCSMAPSTFYRNFVKLTRLPPLQYQKQLRLFEARRLLHSGVSAKSAAMQVGYVSQNQFSREFKRLFGLSPSRVSD